MLLFIVKSSLQCATEIKKNNKLDYLTRITPKYLSSETQVIIIPVALVMMEEFMSHLED